MVGKIGSFYHALPTTSNDSPLAKKAKGLYCFYHSLRGRDLPLIGDKKESLQGLSRLEVIIRIELWLRSTDFSMLGRLFLVNQNLTFIPDGIKRFKNLTWLSVANNYLDTLPNSMKELKQLKFLDISENRFSIRPKVVDELVALENFYEDDYLDSALEDDDTASVTVETDEEIES